MIDDKARLTDERDHWIRLFNRLEAAVSHHKADTGPHFCTDADEALWKAREKIVSDAHAGAGNVIIDPGDLQIDTTTVGLPGEQMGTRHVRVTHVPTSEVAEALGRSASDAREEAVERLREKLRKR